TAGDPYRRRGHTTGSATALIARPGLRSQPGAVPPRDVNGAVAGEGWLRTAMDSIRALKSTDPLTEGQTTTRRGSSGSTTFWCSLSPARWCGGAQRGAWYRSLLPRTPLDSWCAVSHGRWSEQESWSSWNR